MSTRSWPVRSRRAARGARIGTGIVAFAALLGAIPLAALADPTLPGMNLRWDQCYGDGGVANKTFACDTNSGSERLVGSFELAAPLDNVSGAEIGIDLDAATAQMPVWWQFRNTGSCRPTALSWPSGVPAGSLNCSDWASGASSVAIAAYQVGIYDLHSNRILAVSAVSADHLANLVPGVEYFVFQITINHAKTVGTGACAGCLSPVCIAFSHLLLDTAGNLSNLPILQGANSEASRDVTWQNGFIQSVTPAHFMTGWYAQVACLDAATPTLSRTWGEVKALYR